MTRLRVSLRHVVSPGVVALLLVMTIRLLTNSIDTARYSWDFRYYLRMAEQGFATPMAGPFAYRFLTPMLARGLAGVFHASPETGFASLAYFGAVSQLLAVFLFTRWYTHSTRGAWLAMLVIAFSMFHLKFLLFDTFRPDHLAYPLILLQAYFALSGQFVPLVISTIIGCQIREFNAVPLVAYMFICAQALGRGPAGGEGRRLTEELVVAGGILVLALALPRVLIPVDENFQFADFSRDGILRAMLAPLILTRDANFLYSIVAYLLPILMLATPADLRATIVGIPPQDRSFLGVYSALVLVMSFLGGTDFFRFSTYLLVPSAILLGLLAEKASTACRMIVLASVFVFNRIWLPFPMADRSEYLDFYAGYGTRFNLTSVLRYMECGAFIVFGWVCRRVWHAPGESHSLPNDLSG